MRPRHAAAAVLALALAGCAGTAPAAGDAAAATTAPGSPAAQVIEVGYAGGQVTGGGRIPVELGRTVTLRVTSDVADEVHVHGYDLSADLTPGTPATVTVPATVPGVFEVELEELGRELLTLQVQ